MSQKIGIGLVTCNAVEKLKQSSVTIPDLDHFVIVNDGIPYDPSVYPSNAHVIQHDKNYCVAKSKNDAFRYLLDNGCEHIFIMEDDVLIRNVHVFEEYIRASEVSGILHLNYALQGPNNRKQPIDLLFTEKNFFEKLVNTLAGKKILASLAKEISAQERKFLLENSDPAPKMTVSYKNGVRIGLYHHCVGAFSYYRREVLEKTGLMDEHFKNAWEHVEHTYKVIRAGYHPPFWWFADISNSIDYLDNISDAIANSTIARNPQWKNNISEGEIYFKEKTGLKPVEIPIASAREVKRILKELEHKNGINN